MTKASKSLNILFSVSAGVSVPVSVEKRIQKIAEKIGTAESVSGAIGLKWTGDHEMRSLNKKFRRLDKTTDVLSFPMGEDGLVGDIVISVEKARRQASRFHNTPPRELVRLAVHGVYHLLGYDHHRSAEAAEMKRREAWALRP